MLVMQSTVTVLLSLTAGILSIPKQFASGEVRDNAGNIQRVNPDPFSIINPEAEPLFNAETDVFFLLYTRSNPDNAEILQWNNPNSVQNSSFNPADPTRFTIHGWLSNRASPLNMNIRNEYFAVGEFNVITVDWGAGADTINYFTARSRVREVGDITSRMIDTLVSTTGLSQDSVYLIGHSLGAHVAGNAGKFQNGQLNTIFGLDPAGPLFAMGQDDILQPSDAQYVEHLATSAGTNGFAQPLGDATFYANGGRSQPGCGIDLSRQCAHNRAPDLFAESVSTEDGFRATRCASYAEVMGGGCTSSGPDALMGGEPSNQGRDVTGVYRFNTNENPPYAQG